MSKVNSPTLLFVGHLPPPVTGENICRRRLSKLLSALGATTLDVRRRDRTAWIGSPSAVVLINGDSKRGSLFDFMLTLWWGLRGRKVFWYFHNRSWRRFARVPVFLWPTRFRPQPIVITQAIQAAFFARGYRPVLLRNAAEGVFKPRESEQPTIRRLVFVGRLEKAKGFYTALEVYTQLYAEDSRWVFDVYGKGDDVVERVQAFNSAVRLHGWVQGEGKRAAYAAGGILIFPSPIEVLPMVIIEAFSQGVPVVASGVGGIPEMITEGDAGAGIVVRDGAVESYVAAVRAVHADYARYSANALRVFNAEYAEERYIRQVKEIFAEYLFERDV